MKYVNPFIVAGKIDRRYFCDRKDESLWLTRKILNGNNVVVISPRRMGKTGLILYCLEGNEIRSDYISIFIDILQTSSLKEFTYTLGRSVFESIAPRGSRYLQAFVAALKSLRSYFGFDPMTGSPTFNIELGDISKPEITLEEIFNYLEGASQRCVVAIDEFQQIGKYPEKNVESLLRSHIQRCSNGNFIFAGSERHMMQRIFLDSTRPFYQSADILELHSIPKDVYVDFVKSNFIEFDRNISLDAVENVYDLFEGHTFYMQKTFNEVFAHTLSGETSGNEEVENAISGMIGMQDTLYREILSNIPLKQKELLYAVALNGSAEKITSVDFIRDNSLQSASSVQSAARILTEKGLLTVENRVYRVTDRLFAMWIQRNIGNNWS